MGQKISGYIIDYAIRVRHKPYFTFDMYGKLQQGKKVLPDGKKEWLYYPGVLHDIPHYPISKGRLFIGTTCIPDFSEVMKYCSKFEISSAHRDSDDIFLKTGKERKILNMKERGYKHVRNLY